ncbi:sugar ABC transporter permease YjfF [Siculibacillus lacustris]|uniref:Sugar ABC transporter permease YjfF n=1 Tax=Siculibacillus lacustris TaxID=1549641 RepID=A0A4Q9VS14_9HYPH|nr:galactofuranose ABC transporter, permease protein YjfF [Siculibacillus lacustris]TBW38751.1 sugar ABC transporter permease YjfF [Siculibacillus lacustris]
MRERRLPILATIAVFVLLYALGGLHFNHFLSTGVFGNLLTDNAFVIIAGLGMTFVILSGGIDLSVGSMIGFVGIAMATMVAHGWHPLAAIAVLLVMGIVLGALMGWIIDAFEIQPFIVTLTAMFLLRGLCFVISLDSVPIKHPFVEAFSDFHLALPGDGWLSGPALVMLAALAFAVVVAHFTRFGANVYAVGGDAASALLLGVPVRRTIVGVYALNGAFGVLAGATYAFYTSSGYPLAASGVELDAIAAVVIGGTLLTGGVGLVIGTVFGGLIQGLIQTLIIFDGSLDSWWIRIVIGGLLFVFIVLQKLIMRSVTALGASAAPG